MEMEIFLEWASSNGFAIVVAAWMIIKQSKETQALTQAVNDMKTIVEHFCGNKE